MVVGHGIDTDPVTTGRGKGLADFTTFTAIRIARGEVDAGTIAHGFPHDETGLGSRDTTRAECR
jgi:hypothetical protein